MVFGRSKLVFWLLGLLMFLAPLFRSGKVPSALLLLELLSLLILVVLWWSPGTNRRLSPWQILALAGLMLVPLLYLVPLPVELVNALPGRADYTLAKMLAAGGNVPDIGTISLYPRETFSGWLVLLIPLAAYLATRSLDIRQVRALLTLLFVIVTFEAILGLVQFGVGEGPVYLGMSGASGNAVGTYTSRNNYAGLMYMALMVSLALFMATLGQHRARVGYQTLRQRLVYLSTMQGHRAFLYGVFSLLILLAIIFSRSRGGIALTMLGIVLTSLLFSRRIGGRNAFGMAGTVSAIVMGFAISIGLAPVLNRFTANDPVSDGRWTIFDGTIEGITQFMPAGSGPATFRETFSPFQALEQSHYIINNAHNDYLEWIYDGGVLAGLLIVSLLALYILRWTGVWKRERWGEFRYIQVGAGIGMFLMLLHEFVDYNLYVPANMVYFAFFAGLYFYPYDEAAQAGQGRGAARPRAAADNPRVPRERMQPVMTPQTDGGERNPFMD